MLSLRTFLKETRAWALAKLKTLSAAEVASEILPLQLYTEVAGSVDPTELLAL